MFIGWIILCFLVAFTGNSKKIGYWGVFFLSLLLSPIVGLIIGLASKRKDISTYNSSGIYLNKIENRKYNLPDYIDYDYTTNKINSISFEYSKFNQPKYLVVDIETTGLPENRHARLTDYNKWPRIVSIAWVLFDVNNHIINQEYYLVKQQKHIPAAATRVHGITDEMVKKDGEDVRFVLGQFLNDLDQALTIVCHNAEFDLPIIQSELLRNNYQDFIKHFFGHGMVHCTMKSGTNYCKIPGKYGDYKWPKLSELFNHLFFNGENYVFDNLHNAQVDTYMTAACYQKMNDLGLRMHN